MSASRRCERPRIARTLASVWTLSRPPSYSSPMDNTRFNVRSILAGEAPKDAPVTVRGWVRTRRDWRWPAGHLVVI